MNGVEIFGLAMSATVAVSLTQKSVLRLRVINLAGSVGFIIYGILITSYPVMVLNSFTTLANIWYLRALLRPHEIMEILTPPPGEVTFIKHFIDFNIKDIRKFYPTFDFKDVENHHEVRFFPVLRDGRFVSLVICRRINRDRWEILIDYVIPEYRDLKCGQYFYAHAADLLKKEDEGTVKALVSRTKNQDHIRYLKALGFIHEEKDRYILPLHGQEFRN